MAERTSGTQILFDKNSNYDTKEMLIVGTCMNAVYSLESRTFSSP
jgi:hypothetical protein